MIDFHTHILPRIDDGASSVEESVSLLHSLEEQGVNTVALTPHYYGRQRSVEYFLEKRAAAYQALTAAYQGNIRLLRGCECNISTCANADITNLVPLALEGTRYILVELSFEPKWAEDELFLRRLIELKESAGLTPVVAHAELYPAVQRRPEWAARLIAAGCLLQINCQSVVQAGKHSLVQALVAHGQAHCLGSDTHNVRQRPPLYGQAAARLKDWSGDALERIQENMKKIIADQPLRVSAGEPVKKKLFGYA